MLLEKLHRGIGIAGLEKDRNFAALPGFGNQIFGEVGAGEGRKAEVPPKLLRRAEHTGGQIIEEVAGLPAQYPIHRAVFQQLQRFFNQSFLHRRSSNLRLGPSPVTVATKSFMVAANLAPSAALTHSTLVRSRSMPR